MAQQCGDRRWEGNTRCNLGLLMHECGKIDEAKAELQRAIVSARALGHRRLECLSAWNLGIVTDGSDEFEIAKQWYGCALEIADSLRDQTSCGELQRALDALASRAELQIQPPDQF